MQWKEWSGDKGIRADAMPEVQAALEAPFAPEDIEWRLGTVRKDKTAAMALAYLTSRAVQARLDDVFGPHNWQDVTECRDAEFDVEVWEKREKVTKRRRGLVFTCRIEARIDGQWVGKEDGGDSSDMEPIKGGFSGALKRTAVLWGIGRYLYSLPNAWVDLDDSGRRFKRNPILPPAFLPRGSKPTPKATPAPKQEPKPKGKNKMLDPLPTALIEADGPLFIYREPVGTWGELIAAAEEGGEEWAWLERMAANASDNPTENCPFMRAKVALEWLKSSPPNMEEFRAKYGLKDSEPLQEEGSR